MLARSTIEFVLMLAVLAKMATEFVAILSAFVLMLDLRSDISFSNSVILLSKSDALSSSSVGVWLYFSLTIKPKLLSHSLLSLTP